ncbi:PAS domain S-box protein [Cyanobacteria bacterium FACHB-471]|nr:PAS domain S-box protein [Cyanobacteria bacterium FACHB-471]
MGGGEMGALMRSHDWSQTLLGPVKNWSQGLKTAVRIMLTSRQAMFVWWGEDLINLYNDAYRDILGGKHPQALGQPASEVWHEIWDQVGPRAESAMIKNEGTYDEALLLIMERNGYPEETYYTFSYSPIPDDQGRTSGIICANTDDTRRIIDERQLLLLRELAAKTADSRTFDGACTLSANCLGTNLYDLPFAMIYLVGPDDQCAVLAGTSGIERGHALAPKTVALDEDSIWPFAAVLESHQVCLISDLNARFNHLPMGPWPRSPHQAVAVPIAPSGQTGKAGILVAGLNPFRLFDDNYRGFIDLVAAQIAASVANAQAYEEERKRTEALAELDRAKTAFFSNVSHEFRTPLTLMLNPLEDVLANPSGPLPSDRQQLETAYRNSQRLLKLVNTLLDFSRIEAGRVEATYEPTDLAVLTAELAGVFRSAIEGVGIQLRVDCPPLPEPSYIDREMWEKIVLNLLSNAFKFTFEGEIAVVLRFCDDHVELDVQDTGTGIPANELPRIFERFHRVQGARGRTYEGSGIGLSLVQELVHLHGGSIRVRSVVDQGTCFTVSIPTGYTHLPSDRLRLSKTQPISVPQTLTSTVMGTSYVEEALRWLPEESREAGGGEGKNYSSTPLLSNPIVSSLSAPQILLVDDNADMRDYIKRLLSQHYNVEAVSNGVTALAAIRQQIPDLVLTDVMMPELDGFGLLRELRADPQTQELPIILLSARAGEESRIEGLEAGADDYLVKPFSARELLARVEAMLKLSQVRQETIRQERVQRREVEIAKAQLESVLSSINDQFLVLDREWRYVYVNNRVVETVGMSREALLGRSIWEVFPEIVGSEFETQVRQAIANETAVHFEYYYSDWDRWFENHAYPSLDGLTIFVTDISDRKRAEAALRESEARFRTLASHAPVGIFMTDMNGNCVYVNESWCSMAGMSPEAAQGKGWMTALHPDDRERVANAWYESAQNAEIFAAEYRFQTPQGSITWLQGSAAALQRDTGEIVGYLGTLTNISDRKRIEEALQQREAELRLVTNAVPALISFVDSEQRFRFNNRGYEEWFGHSATEIYGKHIREVLGEAAYEGIQLYAEQVLTGQQVTFESQVPHQDGSLRYVSATYVPRFNSDGAVEGFVALVNDISDRKQAEATLRQSEDRLRMAIESAQLGIWDWNLNTNELTWDIGCKAMFGLPPEAESSIEVFYEGLHPDDRERLEQVVQWSLDPASNGIYDVEYRTIGIQDGVERWVKAKGQVYFDHAAHPQRFVGTLLDITEQKQVEIEREQLLAREQAAREQAEAANRIKDEFLAVVSHELRSPLNPILGWAKLLRSRQLDEQKTQHALEVIERNTQIQAQLINDLLDVSRILRGKLSLNITPVDLASTIEAALETVHLAAEAKSIQIRTLLDLEAGHVSGDSDRLQQVVWNLLSNAVKFTAQGGQVEVKLERYSPSHAQITITDTGKGIEPSFLPHVFDRFRQEDAATTRQFGGLGLGLALVRYLVELHGGTVEANSLGEGQGATFTVQLPLTSPQLAAVQEMELSKPVLDLNDIRVLVVDDDASTREFISFLLELHRANVIATSTANEAIALLTQFKPDIILSDIGMPEVDGYMLMQQVRALSPEQGGQTPAIALTAYAGEINYQRAITAGFQKHISKPVEPDILIEAIMSLVEGR